MNTAINAYTSNYESCYSRDAAPGRGSRERERERPAESEKPGMEPADAPTGAPDTANKRRMRVNRVKQTRAALGNNEVTRSNCRSDASSCIYAPTAPRARE